MSLRAAASVSSLVLLIALLARVAVAEESETITVDWIYSDASSELTALPSVRWLDDGTALIFDRRAEKSDRVMERFDPTDGSRAKVVDSARALWSLKSLLGDDAPEQLAWPELVTGDGKLALYSFADDLFVLDFSSATFARLTATAEREFAAQFSPDGQLVSFVRDNDLYVYDIKKSQERRLTSDGSETTLNGTLSWVYWEELYGRHDVGYWWADDSKAIAYLQTDESMVGEVHYVDFKPQTPRLIAQRYPKTGTTNPRVRVGVADVAGAENELGRSRCVSTRVRRARPVATWEPTSECTNARSQSDASRPLLR